MLIRNKSLLPNHLSQQKPDSHRKRYSAVRNGASSAD
jgi:hypothetical protein